MRRTPITGRADRGDERIRLIEEAVLLIRGEWPAVAYGLCETVNRETGLIISTPNALDEAIQKTADEAARVVEELYGHDALDEVRRRADVDADRTQASETHGTHRRQVRLRSAVRAGRRASVGRR